MSVPSIKTATKAAILAVGGLDAAAAITRVGRSQLSDYQNRHSPSVVPVDVAVALDACAQEPMILSAMALAEGHSVIALQFGDGDVAESMERVAASAGATFATTMRVLADGVVTPDEAQDLGRDLADMQRLITHALHVVRGKMAVSVAPVRSVAP